MTRSVSEHEMPPEIALVFPPLVTTNFGKYYPSTAMLSAFLKAHGHGTVQADLNEGFAVDLLRDEQLAGMGEGFFPTRQLPLDAMPCVAARLLARNPRAVFDEHGRHCFQEKTNPLAHLLTRIAEMLRHDFDAVELCDPAFFDSPTARYYLDFYERSGFVRELPASVGLVGISVPLGPQLVPALILARHLAARRPEIKVVLGGPTLSLMSLPDLETLLEHETAIDAVVRFEGEAGLLELVEQRAQGTWSPHTAPGVSCRRDGRLHHVPPGPGPDLDALPFADYDPQLLARLADAEIGIVQARGCYWGRCAYCDYVELYQGSKRYRTVKVDRFVAEMKYQVETHGLRHFGIITESIPPAFAKRMSEAIIEQGFDVTWDSFAMVERHFTTELFELMARGGCRHLEIGVESMTDRVLELVEKLGTRAENLRFLRAAAAAGVSLKVNLIPDLPSTTYDEALASLAAFRSVKDCLSSVGVYPFEPTRSSRIGREPGRYSLQVLDDGGCCGQSEYPANHLPSIDPAMTDAERREVHQLFYDFREEVNGRPGARRVAELAAEADRVDDATPLYLDRQHVDLLAVDGALLYYNGCSRQRFALDGRWSALLQRLEASEPMTRGEAIQVLGGGEIGSGLCRSLLERGLLTPRPPAGNASRAPLIQCAAKPAPRLADPELASVPAELLEFRAIDSQESRARRSTLAGA